MSEEPTPDEVAQARWEYLMSQNRKERRRISKQLGAGIPGSTQPLTRSILK